jgi:dihydrolipoamide dehydrogenase
MDLPGAGRSLCLDAITTEAMNKKSAYQEEHPLVIIGAGTGGYSAAFMAAYLGLDVTLIDPETNPGGVCLYRGCIPTKALLHLLKLKHEALKAGPMGIQFDEPEMNIKKIIDWKDGVVDKLTGGLGQLVKAHKIRYMQGYARFLDAHSLEFEDTEGRQEKIAFEKAIIATGVKARELPGTTMDGKDVIESSTALKPENIPDHMLIVGAGYIGLEMATIYRELGARVSLVEITPDLMPGMDRDLLKEYQKSNKDLFTDVFLETALKEIKKEKNALTVKLENSKGIKTVLQYDRILVAVGGKPDHQKLSLENTGVETDDKGFIKVDPQQQTTESSIFAVGDVTGSPLLAHKATYEGKIAAEVVAGKPSVNDTRIIPSVVYTNPEIATCGLTEKEAKAKDIPFKTARFRWSASGRAVAMNQKHGFTKLLVSPEDERILGAGIVGRDAGDLIPELALAMEMAATATDLAWTIHPHPSLSETIMEAAESYLGHPTHTYSSRK